MIRRPSRSTPLYSSAASDVYKRQVHARPRPGNLALRRSRLEGSAMPEVHIDPVETSGDGDAVDEELVERERANLRKFVDGLSPDEIKSGGWFTQLSAQALGS